MVSYIAQPIEFRRRSRASRLFDAISLTFGWVAYALVALLLRLVMARVFFLDGQTKVVGPTLPIYFGDLSFPVTLPAHLRDEALQAFELQFVNAPVWPELIAYGFAYAEFVLPICLLIGFATRLAALILLAITAALQIYIAPEALWTMHAYWAAILLVLVVCGPGAIALDALIRYLYRK